MGVTNRIFQIHNLLRNGRPVSMRGFMEHLEASKSTIKRDIDLMRDQLGAPLVYSPQKGGYYYDPGAAEFELPGLWFNQSELYALLAAEQLLEEVQPGLLGPQLGPLKSRIRKLLGEGGFDGQTVSSRIHLQSVASRLVDSEHFGTVASAVLAGRQLDVDYRGRSRGQTTQRRINPYRLHHYRDNWYLVAHCEQAGDLRLFSLDRIDKAREQTDPVRPPEQARLERFLNASFGIFSGEAREWAVLRFTPERAEWVADEQWHPDQIGQWKEGGYELQVPYSDPRELMMDILKYGPDVEVIAPQSLREAVIERLQQAAERYNSDN